MFPFVVAAVTESFAAAKIFHDFVVFLFLTLFPSLSIKSIYSFLMRTSAPKYPKLSWSLFSVKKKKRKIY